MKAKKKSWLKWTLLFCLLLFATSIISLAIGSTPISLKRIPAILSQGINSIEYSILVNIRLPRIILAIAIGGALSIAGVILQGMFRNPLVEPYTLGISGGAALGVALSIVLTSGETGTLATRPLSGFAGAAAVIFLIYLLSLKKGIIKINGLLLTGVMISFISSSIIMLLMSLSNVEDLSGIIFWIMGSLDEPSWPLILMMLAVSIVGLALSYFFCFSLNAMALGEEEAVHLGINIEKRKRLLFILASVLTGCAVSVAGIIGFVGLVVPHFIRMVVGQDHRILLITSFLAGAVFLISSDTIARTIISPMELPVGVVTGIVGGIMFVYALTRRGMNL